jgi:hypothetical protein
MAFTNEDWLPTYEELTVPEIGLSSAPLRAGAHQFGKFCDNQCKVLPLFVWPATQISLSFVRHDYIRLHE